MNVTRCLVFLSVIFWSCSSNKKEAVSGGEKPSIPESYLNIRINFSAEEIATGINELLPKVIMDQGIALNSKGDTAFVTIAKTGDMDIRFRGDHAYAALPIRVKASIRKKVMGVTFTNEDTPLEFRALAKVKSEVTLSPDWELALGCNWVELEWTDNPNIKVLGINLDLGKKLDKALEQNQAMITDKLCGAINEKLRFRRTIQKVWEDIQNPIRIAKNPAELWLKMEPSALNAKLLPLKNDMLSISAELRTTMTVSPIKLVPKVYLELPMKGEPLSEESGIASYLGFEAPLSVIEKIVSDKLNNSEYTYEGYTARILGLKLTSEDQRLVVMAEVVGSFSGNVKVKGTPVLSEDGNLRLRDFNYEVELDDQVATATDWALHEFAETYLAEKISYDASQILNSLDSTINAAVAASRLGQKIKTSLDLQKVKSHQIYLSEKEIQWVFYLEGEGDIQLKKGVLTKPGS